MKYELAKKLKNAGFPQNYDDPREDAYKEGEVVAIENGIEFTEIAYAPTLSELIEACGDIRLQSYFKGNKTKWQADTMSNFSSYYDGIIVGIGTTPEEAVANLYLQLNKQ